MNFTNLVMQNLINLPLICFLVGVVVAFFSPSLKFPQLLKKLLTISILFSIGLKGGGPLIEHSNSESSTFFIIIGSLVAWAMIQPILSFQLLKIFTKIDKFTAAAIAACFGSISVITFITAVSFLDQLKIGYQSFIIAALAIMDIPAIISGIFIAKNAHDCPKTPKTSFLKLLKDSLMNKAILSIFSGLVCGGLISYFGKPQISDTILNGFKPILSVFLFDMGLSVGIQRKDLKSFSLSLSMFGVYMPLIGGLFGLLLSYFLRLDPGTGTLVAVLCASASYIAVPAAMKVALPQAKEALYLPLSLAMAFPFNIIIGIPLYYYFACILLGK
jgi:uncharacterized protein